MALPLGWLIRHPHLLVAPLVAAFVLIAITPALATRSSTFTPVTAVAVADAAPAEGAAQPVPVPSYVDEDGDWASGDDPGVGTKSAWHGLGGGAALYPTTPSVVPGESFGVCVSTPATRYDLSVWRESVNAAGDHRELTGARQDGRSGIDQSGRVSFDAANTARANWVVTDTINTKGWKPGVYSVQADDANGTTGYALIVVRTPTISASAPLFIVPLLTYEAYNYWGGASFYTTHTGIRTWRASFDRPYFGRLGIFRNTPENSLLGWLAANVKGLQVTTDYDLSLTPPTVFPDSVILGRHTEYVPAAMFDWLIDGIQTRGVMGLVNFGANSLYWQVRLEPAAAGANRGTLEIVCYKNDNETKKGYPKDPVTGTTATARWRDPIVGRAEGGFMGAQFTAVLQAGKTWTGYVAAGAPDWMLAGTGLVAGRSSIAAYMGGEADEIFPDAQVGSTTTAVIVSTAISGGGLVTAAGATIRTYASGGRIFNASTLAVAQLLKSDRTAEILARNVLRWAAGSAPGANGHSTDGNDSSDKDPQ